MLGVNLDQLGKKPRKKRVFTLEFYENRDKFKLENVMKGVKASGITFNPDQWCFECWMREACEEENGE